MGEGIIPIPADRSQVKFSVYNNKNWVANCCRQNEDKHEKGVAEGQPGEKYDEIFEKKEGKEYKINLDKLPGARLRNCPNRPMDLESLA